MSHYVQKHGSSFLIICVFSFIKYNYQSNKKVQYSQQKVAMSSHFSGVTRVLRRLRFWSSRSARATPVLESPEFSRDYKNQFRVAGVTRMLQRLQNRNCQSTQVTLKLVSPEHSGNYKTRVTAALRRLKYQSRRSTLTILNLESPQHSGDS